MMKKAFVIGLFVAFLLVASVFSVKAAVQQNTFSDPRGDVVDIDNNQTNSRLNVDIKQVTYSINGNQASLSLEVYGTIQDKGNVDMTEDSVLYMLDFTTVGSDNVDHEYTVFYVNTNCELLADGDIGIAHYSLPTTKNITFTFNLNSSSETFSSILAETDDSSSAGVYDYSDDFSYPSEEAFSVQIIAPSSGNVNQSISFSAAVSGGTSPYTYAWDFDGDGSTDSTNSTPTYTYKTEGTYNVTLIVTDSAGTQNSGSDSATITINAASTPGDGGTHTGGTSSPNSGSNLTLFIVLILIIVIVGIAVVVYVIRR